jgi:hypothetical protein
MDERMINEYDDEICCKEYEAVGGMRIDRGNLPQWHFVNRKSHLT